MAKCKLCLEEKTLCKSHIFPEYMYKHCYDGNHSFVEFNGKKDLYNKKRSKGIYEKLLCRECEDIVMEYENYAKCILYDQAKQFIRSKGIPYSTNDYHYNKFKLFVLSLLWRASVCSLDGFELVKLGKYENELREILFHGLETPVNMYPCVIHQTSIEKKLADGVFMEIFPSKAKKDSKTIFQFIADGVFFFIGVGYCSIDTFPQGSSIAPKRLRVGYDELSKLSFFNDLFAKIDQQGKFSVYESTE